MSAESKDRVTLRGLAIPPLPCAVTGEAKPDSGMAKESSSPTLAGTGAPAPVEEVAEEISAEEIVEEGSSPRREGSPVPRPPPAPPPRVRPKVVAAAVAVAARPTVKKARSRNWFQEVFDEDYLRTLPFLTPVATRREAAFVVEGLAFSPPARLLDVGCGYGRHAMELAAQGYQVVALDLSLPLLLRGADEAQRRGLSINFVHGDMRELAFDSQFDGAYCLFSTFGYFDDETNRATIANIAKALRPGGKLVLEILNRDYVATSLPARVWWEGDGCVVLEEVDFDYSTSRAVSNRSLVFEDGRQLEQEISVRLYSLHELRDLLAHVGLRVTEVSGSVLTRGQFFGADSRQLIVVAERTAETRPSARPDGNIGDAGPPPVAGPVPRPT